MVELHVFFVASQQYPSHYRKQHHGYSRDLDDDDDSDGDDATEIRKGGTPNATGANIAAPSATTDSDGFQRVTRSGRVSKPSAAHGYLEAILLAHPPT